MIIEFSKNAWEDFEYWIDNDTDVCTKIKVFIKEIQRTPFKGTGKPEPLKNDLKGYWSRRITKEHRLVYKISGKKGVDQKYSIVQCRFHYDD
ncbi:MAG: Txe/YoeB family addiction module toxin [Crocinitomix sp.]|nr:Txe/YoeB family addiction module toxin [Crocinitomix sp.]